MNPGMKFVVGSIAAALATGVLLHWVVSLAPVWWLAWLAPAPLLLLAFRASARAARWLVLLAALVAQGANAPYLRLVMPMGFVLLVVLLQALLWVFIVRATRRVVVQARGAWSVLAYPVLWVAVDTLMEAFLPDGNWGSLAYSQADVLPVAQLASLAGAPGVLFVLALLPSALAWVAFRPEAGAARWQVLSGVAFVLAAVVAFGTLRLREAPPARTVVVGLAAVDDPIGPRATADYAEPILAQYEHEVDELAADGAQWVVLPEKIAVLRPEAAEGLRARLAALAARDRVWLLTGVGVDDGRAPRNYAWLHGPDGMQAASYEKHKLAPPERREHYASGNDYVVQDLPEARVGIAICKDMHFAGLGHAYGTLHPAVMLVPAWDFEHRDQWLESRTTAMRGIENGYSIVRAGRESLLSVSDPYGRFLAEAESRTLPGRTLLVRMPIGPQRPTLYARTGNLLGWLCVAAALVMLAWTWRRRPQAAGTPVTSTEGGISL